MAKSITHSTCKIRDTTFRHSMPKHEVDQTIKRIKAASKATVGVQLLLRECDIGSAEWSKHCNWLLTSEEAKLVGIVDYAVREHSDLRPSLEACLECVATLDLTKPIPEPVKVYAKKKFGKIDWRPISKFCVQHRTAQEMVRAILELIFKPRTYQYAHKGKGMAKAIARIRSLAAEGRVFFARLDIESFYTNFELEKLSANLPIPKWAVDNVVCGRHLDWEAEEDGKLGLSYCDIVKVARLGIPQGSGISPLVSMIECAKLDLPASIVSAFANYMDDFLHLAFSQEELDAAIAGLQAGVKALPGGHFSLKVKEKGHLKDGCEFLGHQLRLAEEGLTITPSDRNYANLCKRMTMFEEQCSVFTSLTPDKEAVIQAAADATAYIEGWRHAFRECDNLEEFVVEFMLSILQMLAKVGATPEDLQMVRPKVKFDELRHIYE